MQTTLSPIGEKLRDWRQRRRMSQLDLALEADISTRHLSFLETGRAAPSRDMVLRLADGLDVPLRERNAMLLAAGFAPVFANRDLNDARLRPALDAINALLGAHQPFPALCVDRHWTLVSANQAVTPLLEGAAPWLLEKPVNVLRLSLHPEGIAPRIENLAAWKQHLLHRLRRQFAESADPVLSELIAELSAYPAGPMRERVDEDVIAVPLRLRTSRGVLSFLSTTMVFGTALDITVAELAIETFLPADPQTAAALQAMG